MRVFAKTFLTAGDMSANITSSAMPLDQIYGFSIQAVFTDSPVGTLKLQSSCDGTTFSDIDSSTYSVSTAGNYLWNDFAAMFKSVRVVYTFTSGTGSLALTIYAKGN